MVSVKGSPISIVLFHAFHCFDVANTTDVPSGSWCPCSIAPRSTPGSSSSPLATTAWWPTLPDRRRRYDEHQTTPLPHAGNVKIQPATICKFDAELAGNQGVLRVIGGSIEALRREKRRDVRNASRRFPRPACGEVGVHHVINRPRILDPQLARHRRHRLSPTETCQYY